MTVEAACGIRTLTSSPTFQVGFVRNVLNDWLYRCSSHPPHFPPHPRHNHPQDDYGDHEYDDYSTTQRFYVRTSHTYFPLLAATGPPGALDGPMMFIRGL